MLHIRGALGLVVLVLGAIVAVSPAQALVPLPLAGEHLFAGPDSPETQFFTSNFMCDESNQSGTITFTAGGIATGPYPGTFTENGTVVVGPAPLAGFGPVTTVTTSFEITSGSTTITGKKTLLAGPPNQGACGVFGPLGFDVSFLSSVSYTATIHLSPSEAFDVSGSGTVFGHSALPGGFFAIGPPPESASVFEEFFLTSSEPVPVGGMGKVTGGGWILGPTITSRVSFGFEAQGKPQGLHATCTVIDHATKMHVRCTSIGGLLVTDTHATFFGEATVNGSPTSYTIDVDDLGEPGTFDTFKITLGNGYTAAGMLFGGNIQIHKQ